MFRKALLLATFSFLGTVTLAADDEKKPPLGGKLGNLDRSKMFEKMDADSDGKITKDEFKKFREELSERLKNLPNGKGDNIKGKLDGMLDKMFEKMDADGDDKVTKEEFEKYKPADGLNPDMLQKLKDRIKKKDGE